MELYVLLCLTSFLRSQNTWILVKSVGFLLCFFFCFLCCSCCLKLYFLFRMLIISSKKTPNNSCFKTFSGFNLFYFIFFRKPIFLIFFFRKRIFFESPIKNDRLDLQPQVFMGKIYFLKKLLFWQELKHSNLLAFLNRVPNLHSENFGDAQFRSWWTRHCLISVFLWCIEYDVRLTTVQKMVNAFL